MDEVVCNVESWISTGLMETASLLYKVPDFYCRDSNTRITIGLPNSSCVKSAVPIVHYMHSSSEFFPDFPHEASWLRYTIIFCSQMVSGLIIHKAKNLTATNTFYRPTSRYIAAGTYAWRQTPMSLLILADQGDMMTAGRPTTLELTEGRYTGGGRPDILATRYMVRQWEIGVRNNGSIGAVTVPSEDESRRCGSLRSEQFVILY
ncbi:hypothetical protein EV424DRAFT_1351250 [Suillus variegatus]|nr:hypothetical protein EV424DRAFT_1351250 [Suillus variegatus]